jgi:hypothetical protein
MNKTLPAILLMCGLAATAPAQEAPERKLEGSFDQPLTGRSVEPRSGTVSSRIVIVESDGRNKYELTLEDDRLSARIDDQEVPPERIRRSGSRVEILGPDGAVVRTFSLPRGGRALRIGDRDLPFFLELDPFNRQPDVSRALPFEPPPVMLGINMSEPDPAVLEHFGVESGIRVDRVIEGLPADKAGVKVGDVITAVDGQSPVTPDILRKMLREKKPGDTITLRILRKGGEVTIPVELAAYDRQRLGMPAEPRDEDAQEFWRGFIPEGRGGEFWGFPDAFNSPEVRRRIEDAREELRKSIERLRAEIKEKNIEGRVREEVERLVDQLARIRDEMREHARALRQGPEPLRFRQQNVTPDAPSTPQAPEARRGADRDGELAELRRQNQELRQQLEKMNARFDELMKRLDEMSKRGG